MDLILVISNIPLDTLWLIVGPDVKCQLFLMYLGYDLWHPIGHLYPINRSPPKLFWSKQCLILTYHTTVQEARTLGKMAAILRYGLRYGKVCLGGYISRIIDNLSLPTLITNSPQYQPYWCSYVLTDSFWRYWCLAANATLENFNNFRPNNLYDKTWLTSFKSYE